MNPYKDAEGSSFATSLPMTYEDIATKLLKDNFFLTALELHTELVESGKELPQLREFFSNPGNFEQHVSRAGDISTMRTYFILLERRKSSKTNCAIIQENICMKSCRSDTQSSYIRFVRYCTVFRRWGWRPWRKWRGCCSA